MERNWSPEAIDFLRANYGRLSDAEIAQTLGRSVVAITLFANRKLGITKENAFPWDEVVSRYVNDHWTLRELSQCFRRKPQTIRRELQRRGVMRTFDETRRLRHHFDTDVAMRNRYDILADYAVVYLERKNKPPLQTKISLETLPRLLAFSVRWWSHKKSSGIYVEADIRHRKVALHRWILDAPDELVVDHINHDTLDNRLENLRLLTAAQNVQSRIELDKHNTSGERWVKWNTQRGLWVVGGYVNTRFIWGGSFAVKEEAIKRARELRREHIPHSPDSFNSN